MIKLGDSVYVYGTRDSLLEVEVIAIVDEFGFVGKAETGNRAYYSMASLAKQEHINEHRRTVLLSYIEDAIHSAETATLEQIAHLLNQ